MGTGARNAKENLKSVSERKGAYMKLDPTKMKDWQVAEAAEENMPTPQEWQEKLGLEKNEMLAEE